jgi:hypothetical protein
MGETSAGNNQMSPEPTSRRIGLTRRGERMLDVAAAAVFVFLAIGWSWSFVFARAAAERGELVPTASGRLAASLSRGDAPNTAFLTEAALLAFTRSSRGISGRLAVQTALPGDTLRPDSLPEGARIVYDAHGEPNGDSEPVRPASPGIRSVAVAVGKALQPIKDLRLVTMVPFSEKRQGRIGQYLIGTFPSEQGARGPGRAPPDRYANPRGFIQVTLENRDTRVSEHFQLKHFLTKNQPNVWPKYLVLEMRLVDKLELVLADLRERGIDTKGVVVMSGFRTPSYNSGGGNTAGRANLSRHTYGDGADIYIDNDGNGNMDDLNKDGRIDIGDARYMLEAVERVERRYPELIGGAGVYIACCGHGPFIHIDTRGYRARWTGSSGG